MKKGILFFCFLYASLAGLEASVENPKVLVLIIASDGNEAFIELQKIWRCYMDHDPEHFEVYFIRGNPDLPTPSLIEGKNLYVRCEESYVPGITQKTILSMEAMLPRLHEFDFVLRTNLSSFFVFPRLIEYIKTLPRNSCFAGVQLYIWNAKNSCFVNFVSGTGIFLSPDLVEMLVEEKETVLSLDPEMPDDMLLGWFFQRKGLCFFPASRVDIPSRSSWLEQKDSISQDAFHFRAKSHYLPRAAEHSFEDELFINRELLKMFYPERLSESEP